TLFSAHKYAIFYPQVKAFTRGFPDRDPETSAGGATRPSAGSAGLAALRRGRKNAQYLQLIPILFFSQMANKFQKSSIPHLQKTHQNKV
ncbi:MAG TPA: hypothetical protein VN626_11295, partial [Clostridia bacterium]|nr:hypothetical protein [Clostridia bacterium]